MRTRELEAVYATAVAGVRQPHLDRLRSAGVLPGTIARVGTVYPAFGVATGDIDPSGVFMVGEGRQHVLQPVAENDDLIDLVAWRVGTPARWGLVNGLGWLLNADTCFSSRWDGDRLTLHATPLDWLRADATGGVVLDWSSSDLCWLRGFSRIDCGNEMLGATLRKALSKPVRLPTIRTMEVRHVA